MGLDTAVNLIDALRGSQLLSADQLQDIHDRTGNQFAKPVDLARELVNRGWITRYQAQQLMQGHGSDLVLGAYRLLERVGEGGMGQVYKALHQPMHRIVALKIVRRELLQDPRTLKRFRREVQAAAKLKHPNIVTVFDAAQVGSVHFLAMEYIDGADLAEVVRESGPLPIAMACDYIRQAAIGLQHAHERGLVHRDIKPSNLLVTRSHPAGVVKILDMGLARPVQSEFFDQPQQTAVTIDGTVVGTPDFMAPEQARSSNSVDHRADIYSLGCTLYYLLTGRLPFPDISPMDKLIKHQAEQPHPVEKVRTDVPIDVLQVLQGMLAKKPEERIQTAAEVATMLEPYCSDGTAGLVANANDGAMTARPTLPLMLAAKPSAPPPSSTTTNSPFRFDSEPAPATEPAANSKRGTGLLLLASGIGGVVILGCIVGLVWVVIGLRSKPAAATSAHGLVAEPTVPPQTPDELLAAAMIDDAAAVFVIRAGQLLQAPAVQAHGKPALAPIFQFLAAVHADPYKQLERIVISFARDNPDHFLAIILGDYLTPDFRKVLETKLIPEDITWPDHTQDLVYRLTDPQKGQTSYLAIVQQKFVAVASDRGLLQKAYSRFQDRKKAGSNEMLRKALATTKADASVRIAAGGQLTLGDKTLGQLGIQIVTGEALLADEMQFRLQISVNDAQAFRQVKEQITRSVSMQALFNQRLTLLAMILNHAQIEVKPPSRDAQIVELSGKLSRPELNRALPPLFQPWQKR
ncbi:MAG TPA: serine/threonine-protein kinase [Gemmataceae bacterium]|nr:serine/threonine-protein kinase [Gemmataceae bacterium]